MNYRENRKVIFSIIIPMKNAERYINTALNSIINQDFESLQILVIDDNSTDNSKSIVEKMIKKYPEINIELYQTAKQNGGAGGARNIGLDNANGEYVLFLDADDRLNENALNNIKKAIDNNPTTDIFVLGYQLTRCNKEGKELKTLKAPAGKIQESRFFQIGVNTAGQIWNSCFKRNLFGEKDNKNKIRFATDCVFEDVSTKVNLFVRNKKKLKSVPYITHTQYSRPIGSVTGNLEIKDIKRLRDSYREIANLKETEPNISTIDKIYIDARKVSFIGVSVWLIQKAIRNKLDRKRFRKLEEKEDFSK